MDIRNCISELLFIHDCVIIPGFGGFIGNYSPARIDPVHHSFTPPGKKLLFNVNLKQNDGLLANHVAASAGTSYQDACRMIEEMAGEITMTLRSGKSYVFPGVGCLTQGREGNLQFEQDRSVNLLPESFGLSSFVSPPVGRMPLPVASEKRLSSAGQESSGRRITLSRSLRWAAMLAIPVGVAAVVGVTRYDDFSSSGVNNAGILGSVFSRFSSASLVEKKEAPETPPDTYMQSEQLPSVFDSQEPILLPEGSTTETNASGDPMQDYTTPVVETVNTPEPIQAGRSAEPATSDPFAIIVGAFRSKENAEKFIAELATKGVTASLYDRSKGGLFRVAIGTFALREEAEQLLISAKSGDFPGAWLLAK